MMGSSSVGVPLLGETAKFAGNVIGDISGANAAARAAQNAANAQAAAARATRQEILGQSRAIESEAMSLAQATPRELAALDRSYQASTQALAREERMLAAIDPALMEASQQALKLLRGESADINKPMQDLRNSQRSQLLASLRAQYGPGAESTSIGQRALRQFDMETNSMFAQNQQASLAQAFGIASSDFGGRLQRGIGGLQQVGQGYSALQDRLLNTRMNVGAQTLGALSGTSQQMIQSAGAPFVGEALRAQGQQALFNQAVGIGGMAAGNYFAGKGMAAGLQES